MSVVVWWARRDLRLHDQWVLRAAQAQAARQRLPLLPLWVQDPTWDAPTRWGFVRQGVHPQAFTTQAVRGLAESLAALGSRLWTLRGDPVDVLAALARHWPGAQVWTEDWPTPEEQDQVQALRDQGVAVHTVWMGTGLNPDDLPFRLEPGVQGPQAWPRVFTPFRQRVESLGLRPPPPWPAPTHLAPPPEALPSRAELGAEAVRWPTQPALPAQAHLRYDLPGQGGAEAQGLAQVRRYLQAGHAHHYKDTRNQLSGPGFASGWSPWLAVGAVSPRQLEAELADWEAGEGLTRNASPGAHWLRVELLWRDAFRFLHRVEGRRLWHAQGLSDRPWQPGSAAGLARWFAADTGWPWVDAGLRELAASGWVSNRLRQVMASVLLNDLQGDWRAGAAWFEAQLIDHDPCSNTGNWLYIAGRGTDPRGGRRFDPAGQARRYDPRGEHLRRWPDPSAVTPL